MMVAVAEKKPKRQISVRLDPELIDWYQKLADDEERSLAFVIEREMRVGKARREADDAKRHPRR
jgi:hypothetical protein